MLSLVLGEPRSFAVIHTVGEERGAARERNLLDTHKPSE